MFKKNQISVFLVASVMLLSVYYLRVPSSNKNPNIPGNDSEETIRDTRLSQSRAQINDYRDSLRADLMVILGSSTATIQEKNSAIATMAVMETISQLELSLESSIIGLGFKDALVHALEDEVSLTVISTEESVEIVNKLFGMAKSEFGSHYAVSVYFLQPN